MHTDEKLAYLEEILRECESALVAFSGGVDSTFLLKVARDVLGEGVLAVTARSETYSDSEMKDANKLAETLGVRHLTIMTDELSDPRFMKNPPDRCYWCKKELFSRLKSLAREHGLQHVLDGATADDKDDYRPGMRAAREMDVRSPLLEACLGKDDIRLLSKRMGLPTWNKPSLACLASRFPFGTPLSAETMAMVGDAENVLWALGFSQVRVRHHGETARIEVPEDEITRLWGKEIREDVVKKLKKIGYRYVTVDLEGYRTGSMNPE